MSIDDDRARYVAAMHAMQSGVAAKMHVDPAETTSKSLRVGVNSAMVDSAALAKLLMDKGVITEAEYYGALAVQAEDEKALYEKYLSDRYGRTITLG